MLADPLIKELTKTYPIRKIKIFREVIGKLFFLTFLSAVFLVIIKWNGGLAEVLLADASNIIVPTLVVFVFFMTILFDAVYEALYISSIKYSTDDASLTIAKGIISRHEITLPFNRITDLYIDQSVLDRIFGLYDLHFSTPTASSGSAAHISGLNKKDCETLRQIMLDALQKSTSRDR